MSIIYDRLTLLNQTVHQNASIVIKDLTNPTGTTVELTLPIKTA